MGQFLNSINEVKKNYKKYDEWEQNQADERAKKEYLAGEAANIEIPQDKVDMTSKRAETVIRATEIMDARSEDNCENMEQLTGILSTIPIVCLYAAQQPIINFVDKTIQAQINNRITKLKEKMLNKPEQFDSIHAELNKLRNNRPNISNMIKTGVPLIICGLITASTIGMILCGNSKQKEASRIGRYQAKQNELKGLENFVIYTPEQIEKAKEIAKSIPDEKERNSISKMIKELKDVVNDEKAYKKWLSQKDPDEIEKLKAVSLSPEQIEKAREDQELIVDAVKEINIKAEEYSENLENAYDTLETVSFLFATPLGLGIKKIMKLMKSSPKVRTIVSFAVPIITTLGIQMNGTIEQKTASRIGRYKARQDLMKNPARLMAYSDEDMKKAENIKAPKQKQSFFEKIGGSFSFLSTYYKDRSEYKKYKKTTQKENEKLQKAFKKIEISEAQKADAKAIQKNVYRVFDEVDEMSQRYSEDVEAGTEIAKQIGATVWSIGSTLGLFLLGANIIKGKFPVAKTLNWLTNLTFDSKSSIRTGINNFYKVLKNQDKVTIKEFQKSLVSGDLKSFFREPQNTALKEAAEPLLAEFGKIGQLGISQACSGSVNKDMGTIFSEILNSHFKQTKLAEWTRNMVSQCSKLWAKSRIRGMELPEEVQQQLGMNFNYKNYKTLINTGLVAGIPVLGVIVGVPYAFNAWLTSIQKKAGKIGIMKAMDKIDDPRIFAPELQAVQDELVNTDNSIQHSNLLNKIRQEEG